MSASMESVFGPCTSTPAGLLTKMMSSVCSRMRRLAPAMGGPALAAATGDPDLAAGLVSHPASAGDPTGSRGEL